MLKMRVHLITLTIVLLAVVLVSTPAAGASMFAGQDLHLAGEQMTVYADSEIAAALRKASQDDPDPAVRAHAQATLLP